MNSKITIAVILSLVVISSCTQTGKKPEWSPIEDEAQAHITVSFPEYALERTTGKVQQTGDFWFEEASWAGGSGDMRVFIAISAYVHYEKLFMSSHVQPVDKRARDLGGGIDASMGARDRVTTKKGFYEYQLYDSFGLNCFYLQAYWGDRSFAGVDVVRGAKVTDKIVGNHMLQANFCAQRERALTSDDVRDFVSGIELRDAYWPMN